MSADRVLVVIGRTRHKMVVAELLEAVKRGTGFIELRLDFLAKAVDFKRLTPYKQCPWVATLRRPAEGGRCPGAEDDRQKIIRQAIVSGSFEWVDLETDIARAIPRFGPVKRIVSYHNLTETPLNLDEIYADMVRKDGDVYKIAVLAQSAADVTRVLRLQRTAKKPTIAFCMGDIGQPSRFLALKYGAPWIYAAFNKERGIAPGLPSMEDFRTTYPVRGINADTKVFGVVETSPPAAVLVGSSALTTSVATSASESSPSSTPICACRFTITAWVSGRLVGMPTMRSSCSISCSRLSTVMVGVIGTRASLGCPAFSQFIERSRLGS